MPNNQSSNSNIDPIVYSNALESLVYFKGLYLAGRESDDPLIKEIVSKNWEDEIFNEAQIPNFFYHITIKGYIPLKNAEAAAAVELSSNQALLNLYNRTKNDDGLGMVTYVNPERKGTGSRSSFIYSPEALFRLYMYLFLLYIKEYEHDTIFQIIGYSIMQTSSAVDEKSFIKNRNAKPTPYNVDPYLSEIASLQKNVRILTSSLVMITHKTDANKKYIARSSTLISDLNMKLHAELEAKIAANNVSISELNAKMSTAMDDRNKLDLALKEREIIEIKTRENIKKLESEIEELQLEQKSESPIIISENSTTLPKENVSGGFFKKLFGGGAVKETVIEKVIEKKDNTALIESLSNQLKMLNDILMEPKNAEWLKREIELQDQFGRSLVAQVDNLIAEQLKLSEEKVELIKMINEHQQLALEQPSSDELSPEFVSLINNLQAIGIAEPEDATWKENEQSISTLNNGNVKHYIDATIEE